MGDLTTRISLSKRGRRQLTSFMGDGLLYDYARGTLDEERRVAVEEYLSGSLDAQSDLKKIQAALKYTDAISQVGVSQELSEKLSVPSSYFSVLFQKSRFHEWPAGIKWGLEALAVISVIVTVLIFTPWEKIVSLRFGTTSNEVVLAEINKKSALNKQNDMAAKNPDVPEFVDEGIKSKEEAAPAPTSSAPTVKTTAVKPVQAPSEEISESDEGAREGLKVGGFLYRGKIEVTNLEAIGPKIKDKIIELGGRKAGEVDLGWQKSPESAYFHFTIPEAKYQDLEAFLSEYGTTSISKEKHPRLMPEGIIRLIITVDEAKK